MSDQRIDKLEQITTALSIDLSQIRHDMAAIRRELIGSHDGLTEGALVRLNRKIGAIEKELDDMREGSFSNDERDRILKVVSFFEGWKVVIAAIVFVAPIIVLIITLLK